VMSLKLLRRVIFDVMFLGNATIPLLFRFFDSGLITLPAGASAEDTARHLSSSPTTKTFSASSNGWNIEGGLEEA